MIDFIFNSVSQTLTHVFESAKEKQAIELSQRKLLELEQIKFQLFEKKCRVISQTAIDLVSLASVPIIMGIRGGNLGFIAGNTWRFGKYLYEQAKKKRKEKRKYICRLRSRLNMGKYQS